MFVYIVEIVFASCDDIIGGRDLIMRDPTIDAAGEYDMMFELQGYRTVEKLGSQEDISLYRLQRYSDRLSVIAMTTRDSYPDEKQVSLFYHQYDMLRKLDGRGR